MEALQQTVLEQKIPGVRPADQQRSRQLQERFTIAGREELMHSRLHDLSIPALAQAAGSSVGGFYSRFESKEAFFEFMRFEMLNEHKELYDNRLSPERFKGKAHQDVSEVFIDVMLTVFSGPWRGVLREAYALIPSNPESWEPMKERGRWLRRRAFQLYEPLVEEKSELEERISIALQLLFSALNNEMMNANLAFNIEDGKFRHYLVATLDTLVSGKLPANLRR